jgi:methylaspartate mutase sigma subunit
MGSGVTREAGAGDPPALTPSNGWLTPPGAAGGRSKTVTERLAALAPAVQREGLSVVIGVPGDDVHVVANKVAEALLTALGYEVVNLGVLVPVAAFVEAAGEVDAAAVVLSSLNGHALANCGELPRELERAGLQLPVYLGGNVSVGRQDWDPVERRFYDLGFARLFPPHATLPDGVAEFSADLLGMPRPPRMRALQH